MKPLFTLARCLGTAFLPALTGYVAKPDGWYKTLEKPPLNPPPKVFPIVWTMLYTMMGIAHYTFTSTQTSKDKTAGHRWYATQLILNAAWSPLFFGKRAPRAAFVDIVLLIIAIGGTIREFNRVSKTSGRLLLPYFLWCCFASYLNFEICRRNPPEK